MDFRTILKETENSIKANEALKILKNKSRMFESIEVGDYNLSIQASYAHYCNPRQTLDDLNLYTEMEIAIFKDGEWVQPSVDERFTNFKRLEELLEQYENGDCAIGAFVPVDLIQDLYDFLKQEVANEA